MKCRTEMEQGRREVQEAREMGVVVDVDALLVVVLAVELEAGAVDAVKKKVSTLVIVRKRKIKLPGHKVFKDKRKERLRLKCRKRFADLQKELEL